MKKTRFEVESDVSNLVEDIAEEYAIEKDFFGDCYPNDVMKLENQMELCSDEYEYDDLLDEVEKILKGYVPKECKFEGKKWGSLTEDEKKEFLDKANICNDAGPDLHSNGDCIIDFEVLSVSGKQVITEYDQEELVINDDTVLYNARR